MTDRNGGTAAETTRRVPLQLPQSCQLSNLLKVLEHQPEAVGDGTHHLPWRDIGMQSGFGAGNHPIADHHPIPNTHLAREDHTVPDLGSSGDPHSAAKAGEAAAAR